MRAGTSLRLEFRKAQHFAKHAGKLFLLKTEATNVFQHSKQKHNQTMKAYEEEMLLGKLKQMTLLCNTGALAIWLYITGSANSG